jgi:hypothetical protein
MSKGKTSLNSLSFNEAVIQQAAINLDAKDFKLFNQFMDLSISNENKDKILQELNRRDPLLLNELFNNVMASYMEEQTSYLTKNIYFLINNEFIDFPKRIQLLELLVMFDKKTVEKVYTTMINLLFNVSTYDIEQQRKLNVSTTLLFDTIRKLLHKEYVKTQIESKSDISQQFFDTFNNIFKNKFLNEDFKYKLFDSIKKDSNISVDIKIILCLLIIVFPFDNYIYNLFLCQYLLSEKKLEDSHVQYLYQIAKNSSDELCIANISDFLLDERMKDYNKLGIDLLSTIKWDSTVKNKNIYNNKQNIHSVNIDKSVKPFLEKLINSDFGEHIPTNMDEDKTHELIEKILETCKSIIQENDLDLDLTKIERTIQRFILDNTVYTDKLVSLLQLLFRCYFYIIITNNEDKELLKRFVEELHEMADTCTTGHLVRLVNIFSGFDAAITIDIEDELKGCIFQRLTNIINSKSEDEQDKIYEDTRSEDFMKILSKDLVGLYNELEKEYVESKLMSATTLQETFRRYIGMFQIGEKV